jgi:hypothetical protein
MKSLKGLVIALAVLIVASFGLLLYGFITRISGWQRSDAKPAAVVAEHGASKTPQTVRLDLPADCRIIDVMASDGRLVVRTGPVGACERVLVVDLDSGHTIADISLRPPAP